MLYSNDFKEREEETGNLRDHLFSGVMTAIQSLMSELSLGELNHIKTADSDIVGYESISFKYFLIGDHLQNVPMIEALLTEFATFFESLGDNIDRLGLSDKMIRLLDQKVDDFRQLYERKSYNVSVLRYSPLLGVEELTKVPNQQICLYLSGYFGQLDMEELKVSHAIYSTMGVSEHLLALTHYNELDETVTILALYFTDTSFLEVISYKHHFINLGFDTMNIYIDELNNELADHKNKEEVLETFFSKLETSRSAHEYRPNAEFNGSELLFNTFGRQTFEIIGTLLAGIPLAIIAEDEQSAKEVIDFIVFVTGLNDVSIELISDAPRRIIFSPPDLAESFEMMGYAFVDLEQKKLERTLKTEYFENLYEEVEDEDNLSQILFLKYATKEILNKAEQIMYSVFKGGRVEYILDFLDDDERELIQKILRWINPYILTKKIAMLVDGEMNW